MPLHHSTLTLCSWLPASMSLLPKQQRGLGQEDMKGRGDPLWQCTRDARPRNRQRTRCMYEKCTFVLSWPFPVSLSLCTNTERKPNSCRAQRKGTGWDLSWAHSLRHGSSSIYLRESRRLERTLRQSIDLTQLASRLAFACLDISWLLLVPRGWSLQCQPGISCGPKWRVDRMSNVSNSSETSTKFSRTLPTLLRSHRAFSRSGPPLFGLLEKSS